MDHVEQLGLEACVGLWQALYKDEFIWHYNDMAVLFAAGTSGEGTVYYGEVIRRLNTVLSPGFSKNVITAGAVYNVYRNITDGQNYVTYFSSRGDNTKGR